MDAGYFIIAILGCGDGADACLPVAMAPTHYVSEQACMAARGDALTANTDLDFPTLLAQCLPMSGKASTVDPGPPPKDAVAA